MSIEHSTFTVHSSSSASKITTLDSNPNSQESTERLQASLVLSFPTVQEILDLSASLVLS
ncbi:TPA: hypothetical protein DIC40_06560 [Patescibacteria group bacterium]|nr:hypothetical protein [Candidatus Gracilibacteria bacterium]